jgi:hypothetical protein
MIVFQSEYAKELKINYKNGKSFKAFDTVLVEVLKSGSNGHNISYMRRTSSSILSGDGVMYTYLQHVQTNTDDVVSVELRDTIVNGMKLDFVKKFFIR